MIIGIKNDFGSRFEGDEYIVDTNRPFGGAEKGDLICTTQPFFGVPLTLEIAIRADGSLIFRAWKWAGSGTNAYLHTREKPASKCGEWETPFVPTAEQIDTVGGLFSGRIKFEGLKLSPGGTLQAVCPIDLLREEQLIGKQIYLA